MDLTLLKEANWQRYQTAEAYKKCLEWTIADWGNALAGETGEMCNLIKKIRQGREVDVNDVGKELADIVIYADLIASHLGLNLADCLRNKFNEVSDRVHSSIKL